MLGRTNRRLPRCRKKNITALVRNLDFILNKRDEDLYKFKKENHQSFYM